MSVSASSSSPLPRSVGWTQRTAASIARGVAQTCCALEVEGLEHLPRHEPVLLCANHSSHADTFTIAAALGPHARRLVFLAAHDYFSHLRFRGWLLHRLICLLPFDRRSGAGPAKHNLRVLGACRDAGRIIVLFPEGTRSPNGEIREFKPGVAMFADRLGLRVVPCRIEGSHAMLPKGKKLPRPAPLRLTLGAALRIPAAETGETTEARGVRYTRFTRELQATIASLGGRTSPRPRLAVT